MKFIKTLENFSDSDYNCPECGSSDTISKSEYQEKEGYLDNAWSCDEYEIKCRDCGTCYETPDV